MLFFSRNVVDGDRGRAAIRLNLSSMKQNFQEPFTRQSLSAEDVL